MIPDEQIDPASPVGQAQSFLKELTHLMGVDVTVAMGTDAENNIFAQMTGDTLGILIGRRGETLDALQYLTSRASTRGRITTPASRWTRRTTAPSAKTR